MGCHLDNPDDPNVAMRRLLCDNMAEGFFVVEVLLDDQGRPQDGVVREVNVAFVREGKRP